MCSTFYKLYIRCLSYHKWKTNSKHTGRLKDGDNVMIKTEF